MDHNVSSYHINIIKIESNINTNFHTSIIILTIIVTNDYLTITNNNNIYHAIKSQYPIITFFLMLVSAPANTKYSQILFRP